MKTSDNPICGQTGVTNDVSIDFSAIVNETVYLFVGKYLYFSVIHMKRHVIEVKNNPIEFAKEWKTNANLKFKQNTPISGSFCYYSDSHKTNAIILFHVIYY